MPLKVNSLVVVQVKKEDIGSLLDDAVKQGTKPKIGEKAEKENSEEVDDPTPTSKPVNAVRKPPQVQVAVVPVLVVNIFNIILMVVVQVQTRVETVTAEKPYTGPRIDKVVVLHQLLILYLKCVPTIPFRCTTVCCARPRRGGI